MAFEDQSTPNVTTSPNTSPSTNIPTYPMVCSPLLYTCKILPVNIETTRILSYKIGLTCVSLPSMHTIPEPKTENYTNSLHRTTYPLSSQEDNNGIYNSASSPQRSVSPIPGPSNSFKYTIDNILQPDFGKSAVIKSKTNKITYKQFEHTVQYPIDSLGSLCQNVSQFGKSFSDPEDSNHKLSKSPADSSSGSSTHEDGESSSKSSGEESKYPTLWPAWVYCTRYSDRPSSGPRSRRMKKTSTAKSTMEEKRPRTAFSGTQLAKLKHEFAENRYLTERRRQQLSSELGLNEAQIKIWFQNKRAKIKKTSGHKNPLALQLMAQGLYNHSTVTCDEDDIPLYNVHEY